uniref:IncF plasmid conjugative transfer pilin acetylase TraX n=1 Tax=Klebsiella pneumoniae TaxID=573 RepID=A0A7D5G222_KLEPN|nr:IncF plasmid conjugative transfer pilin acetylase TraX [Klebsiella pneumoniae]
MRLLGRGCFPLFGLAWGMNLARHAEIRQSQLNSLWGWALVAQVSFMLIGTRGIPGIFCLPLPLRARSCGGSASRPGITPPGGWTAGHLDTPVNRQLRHGRSGHAHRQLAALSRTACTGTAGIRGVVGLMVLLMNMHDVSESVAGLAIALLTLMVCSSAGERVKRFWPRQFFVMFYAVHLAVLGIVVSM